MHLIKVIQWKSPTARCGTSGMGDDEVLLDWEGPEPRPTVEQLAQWKQEYVEQGIEAKENATRFATSPDMTALVNVLADKLNVSAETLTQDLITARENEEP